ncbi:hypothetical protein I2492_19415 [Budviciaceae bacterium CWB-B4]|uniref:Uncharacterized protein n=1 Tax=Limnobaculum xujianqingii TaxID=2738837 RepID=A0A9D7ALU1_9GAMM|nr:hypothetical protein [Limnobaculum xujianqingii]MBK5075172.1 hypothetical protein [Limnobaculum xujianqingii]MBK5178480.1 hypothetical protein [Limnobaculum xujianqingii]
MGDMADVLNDLKEIRKQEKEERYEKNILIIQQCKLNYHIDDNGTVLFKTIKGTVCFYPSTNKFMLKNKVHYGDANSVIGFIKNLAK